MKNNIMKNNNNNITIDTQDISLEELNIANKIYNILEKRINIGRNDIQGLKTNGKPSIQIP